MTRFVLARARGVATVCQVLAAVSIAGCGGGSSSTHTLPILPSSPTSSATPIAMTVDACGAITGFSGVPQGIVNGVGCSRQQADSSSVVPLQMLGSDGEPQSFCSGTVIDANALLTAAHCLTASTTGVAVYLGFGRLPLKAKAFYASPDYSGMGSSSLDVGVVIFEEPLERTPVPLMTSRAVVPGETALVAGFGVDGITSTSAALRAGVLTVTRVTSTKIEAAYSSTMSSVCSGDSGGPLLVSQDGVWSVAGVTSAVTPGCLSGTSYYAKVSNPSVKDFILKYVPGAAQR